MATEKVPGLRANITLNLQSADDVGERYGWNEQVTLSFDVVLSDRAGQNAVEEFTRQMGHALNTLARKKATIQLLREEATPPDSPEVPATPLLDADAESEDIPF